MEQAERGAEQGGVERAVWQDPACGGDAEDGRNVQGYRGPEPGPPVGYDAADAPDQELRASEQQDEGEADCDRWLGSQQMGGTPGEPPTGGRMVEIAETECASGCHHIAFVDPKTGGCGEDQPDQGGRGDQLDDWEPDD